MTKFTMLLILGGLLISGCTNTATSIPSPQPTDTTMPSVTPSPTLAPTMHPTHTPRITPTTNWKDFSWLPAPTIGMTQIPPIIEPPTGEDDMFLYKDVIVTITFDLSIGWGAWGLEYLNLDDLENNGLANSDVLFSVTEGTIVTYGIGPANQALNYPAQTDMDFASCVAHLEEFGGYTLPDSNLPFCFLTDEGRIGIVQYVPDSVRYESEFAILSYRVTVYKQNVDR